jgi:hypothetical protein
MAKIKRSPRLVRSFFYLECRLYMAN